jgi:hypothetical protein
VAFANGSAEGPWGKLALGADGELSGWMNVPARSSGALPLLVNLAGRSDNEAFKGIVSGRCSGTFTIRKA